MAKSSDQPRLVIWGACVIIAYIEDAEGKTERLQPFIDDAEAGELLILVPETSVVEVLSLRKHWRAGGDAAGLRDMYLEFLQEPFIVRVPLHADLAEQASEIATTAPTKIKGVPDAVLIALAVANQAVLHTYDGETKPGPLQLDGLIGDPPVQIRKPVHGQDTLFAGNV